MSYRESQQSGQESTYGHSQVYDDHRRSYGRTASNGESLYPSDSASNAGEGYDVGSRRDHGYASHPDYLAYDPYGRQEQRQRSEYAQQHRDNGDFVSNTPAKHTSYRHQYNQSEDQPYYPDQHYLSHEQDASNVPLVHFAGNAGGYVPPYQDDRASAYSGAPRSHLSTDKSRYSPLPDHKEDFGGQNMFENRNEYPPNLVQDEKDPFSDPNTINTLETQPTKERPPIWQRLIRDTTPLDQRIENHKRGIGVQQRPWLCWVLSAAMIGALIAEMAQNWRFTGIPIAIKPYFNFMIGPSANILIYTGARFTPCIKDIPSVSSQNFACLNNTAAQPTTLCTLSDICGFGGFPPGQANQSFRFILPIFLHAGIIHIFFNLIVQNTTSAQIEREMGSLRFAILYFCSGIFGFVLGGNFALVGQPSVGASGAIYGVQAALLVDLIAHWSIERRPGRKLVFLLIELVIGMAIGFIPNTIDNFSHIGGFLMGLCISVVLYPAIHQTKKHRTVFYVLRGIAIPGVIVLFVVLVRNFYTSDPSQACSWCRYISCWPTAANNHCKGTGLTTTTTTTSSFSFLSLLSLFVGYYFTRR